MLCSSFSSHRRLWWSEARSVSIPRECCALLLQLNADHDDDDYDDDDDDDGGGVCPIEVFATP